MDQPPNNPAPATGAANENQNSGTFAENALSDVQNRIFHAMFYRLAVIYARIVPRDLRRFHEFLVLCSALLSLFTLVHLRILLQKSHHGCLTMTYFENVVVYRIELVHDRPARPPYILKLAKKNPSMLLEGSSPALCPLNSTRDVPRQTNGRLKAFMLSFRNMYEGLFKPEEFILEVAAEYGFLRLSDKTREALNIPVVVIEVESSDPKCFGNAYSRLILQELFGYQEILISNVDSLLGGKRGYVRNIVTGESFRFVSTWVTKLSFLSAFTVMIIFTLSISILLRYCHNQIFFFIVELLHMFEINVIIVGSPVAPLITAILALIGVETIMSEFFNDSSTAFCIIVLVWMADQFYSVCCRTEISEKYWVRFFFLYQFAFYAYYVRYNGQYSGLALFSTYAFVIHSMLYFFNHYELPALVQRTRASTRAANPDAVLHELAATAGT